MSATDREKAKASGWKSVNEVDPFPEHIKEWAFQLYAYKCARDSKRVAAYMRSGEYDGENEVFPPTKVSDRTIRAWAKRHNWSDRQLKENKALHADLFNTVAAQNIHNSVDAIRVQSEIVGVIKEDVERIASWRPDPENPKATPPELRIGARELKAVADFTNGILDRAGHTAWTRRDIDDKPVGPTATHADAIGGKSMQELIEMSRMKIFELAASSTPSTPDAHHGRANLNDDESSVIEVSPHAPDRGADRGAS